jgi:hypothetical protein
MVAWVVGMAWRQPVRDGRAIARNARPAYGSDQCGHCVTEVVADLASATILSAVCARPLVHAGADGEAAARGGGLVRQAFPSLAVHCD